MNQPAILRQLWRQCIHTEPAALEVSGVPWSSIWEPSLQLLTLLEVLPAGLLAFWVRSGRGHIVIGSAPSGYAPGWQEWQERSYEGLCRLHSSDIAHNNMALWDALLAWCDHLLGSTGQSDGARLSAGQGATPRLQTVAARLQQASALGYAWELLPADSAGKASAYLSGVWRLYLNEPAQLNTADPLAYRVLHDSLMNADFWRLVSAEADDQSGAAVRS